MNLNFSDAFGYHKANEFIWKFDNYKPSNPLLLQEIEETSEQAVFAFNALKIIDYIPILGTIAAIYKLHIYAQSSPKAFQGFSKGFFLLRSLVALPSLGFLLIIPDLIVTLNRRLYLTPSHFDYVAQAAMY